MSNINSLVLEKMEKIRRLHKPTKDEEKKLLGADPTLYPIVTGMIDRYSSTRNYGYDRQYPYGRPDLQDKR